MANNLPPEVCEALDAIARNECDSTMLMTLCDYCERVTRENAELRAVNESVRVCCLVRTQKAEAERDALRDRLVNAHKATASRNGVVRTAVGALEPHGRYAVVRLGDGDG